MNLCETGIGKECASLVSPICRCDIAAACVGRKVKDISVTTGSEHNRVGCVRFDFSGDQTPGHDAFGVPIDQDKVEHFCLGEHFDCSGCNLPAECLISAKEKLLAGLAAGVKCSRNLSAAKRAIGQQTSVFPGERNALLDTLIDDQVTDFSQAINVRFACPKIATFDRVVKKPENAIAIVLVIFRCVNSALSSNTVSASRAVLITEALHLVAEFSQGCCGGTTGQTASDDDDLKFPAIVRTNQSSVVLVVCPFFSQWARRNPGIKMTDHNC